jgi:type IV pilus assembly protein PilW
MNNLLTRNSHPLQKNKGFTLVELMITLVLSLMITYAIAQVLISSNRTSVTSDGMSQSQETGRFVMSFLASHIRQAGLDSITNDSRVTDPIISCSDFPNLAGIGGNPACTLESNSGGDETNIYTSVINGDRLAIAWIPPVPLDAANNPDPDLITDCTGEGGYSEDDIILNVFWVAPDANGMSSLFCQGHTFDGANITDSNDAQAIANGVDSMHVLFGEAIDPLPADKDRNVGRYSSAASAAAGGVTNWNQVYSIKISILTRSITDVTNEVALRRYVLLDAQPYLMEDAINRQVFNSTFVISNHLNN